MHELFILLATGAAYFMCSKVLHLTIFESLVVALLFGHFLDDLLWQPASEEPGNDV